MSSRCQEPGQTPVRPFCGHKSDLRRHALAVTIINYKTAEMTLDCVRSVLAAQDGLDLHVVVIDNRSDDGSVEQIEAWITRQDPAVPVTLLRSPTNSGFSGGHNQGFAAVPADWYFVLNSDAIVRPGALRALMEAAQEAPPETGLLSPLIEYEDGTLQNTCFRAPGPLSEFMRVAASAPVTALFRHRNVVLGPDPATSDIEWVTFAAVLLRAEMIDRIGPMDSGYFMYFEDAEYGCRARRAGWGIAQVRAARVLHLRGKSSPVKSLAAARKRLPGYFYAARTRFLYQRHGAGGLILANVLWYLGRAIAHLRPLTGKPIPPVNAAEARDIWINLRDPLGDPRAPQ